LAESTIFATVMAMVAFWMRGRSAAARYIVWFGGAAKFAVPAALFAQLGVSLEMFGSQQFSLGTHDHGVRRRYHNFPAIQTSSSLGSDSDLWRRRGDRIFAAEPVGTLHFERSRRRRLGIFDKPVCSAAQLTLASRT